MEKKRILVIEDDRDIRFLLQKRLLSSGFSCLTSSTVEEALLALKESKPDLVILDLGFPGASGTAFLQNAKSWLPPGHKIPPVIVVSGNKEKEVVDYAMDSGASGFLGKPIDTEKLVTLIQRYLV